MQQDWEQIRLCYRPDRINVLFIGESPPPSGKTFFYAGNSILFDFWKSAFTEVFSKSWPSPESFLRWFQEQECYLDDLLSTPLPYSKTEKIKMRKALLPKAVSPFARKLRDYKPEAVVAVMKCIDSYVKEAIEESESNIAYEIVGFPYKRNGKISPQTISEAQHVLTKLKQQNIIDQ